MSDAWWREAQDQRERADKAQAAMAAMKELLCKLASEWDERAAFMRKMGVRSDHAACETLDVAAEELRERALKEMP